MESSVLKTTKILKRGCDKILNFWEYLTDGEVIIREDGSVVLQDYSESITYKDKQEAASVALECIKQWAEDDGEAMAFVEDIRG